MEAALGMLLMLLGACHGVVTECDGRVNGTQCHGRLGGTVCLQLKKSPSDVYRFTLRFGGQEIIKVANGKVTKNLTIPKYTYFFNNGTFCMNNLNRNDSGFYKLYMYDSNGRDVGDLISHLSVEAPVSSVSLVLSLSKGELSVSCSAEGGDSPLYNWTLDGRSLTTDKFILKDEKPNIIILKKQSVLGLINCFAKNNVSSVSREINLSTSGFIFIDCIANGTKISEWVVMENNTLCLGKTIQPENSPERSTDSPLLTCSLMFLFAAASFVGIGVFFKWKKSKYVKAERSATIYRRNIPERVCEVDQGLYCNT